MVTITKAISCVFTKERKDIIIEGRVRKLRMCNREESGFSPPRYFEIDLHGYGGVFVSL